MHYIIIRNLLFKLIFVIWLSFQTTLHTSWS